MSPRISVVVPTYQRRDSLRRLLTALATQRLPAERFEVIVVIDGATDGTAEMVSGLRMPFRLVHHVQANAGRAAACNAGLALASGDLVLLLDDDMVPLAGCLAAHDRAHSPDGPTGIIGAAPPAASGRSVGAYLADKFERHLENLARDGYELRLRDFYTGNFSIEREVLCELGGFDTDFTIYGNEDVELFARLRRAGIPVRFDCDAAAIQHFSKDLAKVADDQIAKGRTAVLLAQKHPDLQGELKLATAREASVPIRMVRDIALRASDTWPSVPYAIVRCAVWLERISPYTAAATIYPHLFGYLYWVGARAAQREAGSKLPARKRLPTATSGR